MATVVVSAQANGLKRVIRHQGKGAGTRRNDEERGRETVALQSAGSFIAGTVKAARPERSQQALLLTLTSDIRH
ncbi:hypothetical protein [Klebsiella pneumoniae]|uniref:hypothetical protein n=1 Tax=Klebsiella pneumoniae TaxID=573 RepID=UPI000F1561DF|nr:hypothetical protein [Klebsiella pneumoniae]VCV94515.1 hypothetical protein BANRA_05547 [Klebsiella pneumoniae]